MDREKYGEEFEVLNEGLTPECRMGLLHKDGCCGGRA